MRNKYPMTRKLKLSSVDDVINDYEFEPIQGFPMLSWKGKRPFQSTQYYPAQLKEVHGPEVAGWRNKIYWGDNLQVMSHLLKEFRGRVSLVYIDPPFDSKAVYKKKIQLQGRSIENDQSVFEEKQYTDIWTNDDYLQFMYERLILLRELLTDHGSIYLHCDWHKSHHLRCLMDEVFGQECFVNEIVWLAEGGGSSGKRFGRKHQTILFYSKGNNDNERIFNADAVRVPYKTENIKPQTYHFDSNTKRRPGFKEGYTWVPNEGGKVPTDAWLDCFLAEGEGIPLDIWWDVKGLYGPSGELEKYPTQKPIKLLERIIAASTNPGDIVLDCFMGSGTTQAVAMKQGRRFLGADINLGAVQTTTKRLLDVATHFVQQLTVQTNVLYHGLEVYNVNHYDVFRNPVQAKELLIEALEIQPLALGATSAYDGEKDGRMVKIMPINRIATRADLNDLIAGFDYKTFERRLGERPNTPVERVLLVTMGHEPDLVAHLKSELHPFQIDVEVVDILRDESRLEFRRPSEAKLAVKKGQLVIQQFYPVNLLQKLSLMKEDVSDWRELVESVMIDWNYDGAVLTPAFVDLAENGDAVAGSYQIPEGAGTIRVKITDLLSESWEGEIQHG
jgi:DNA modification methylase